MPCMCGTCSSGRSATEASLKRCCVLGTPQESYAVCFLPSYHCNNIAEGCWQSLRAPLAARHDCSGDDWDLSLVCLIEALEAWGACSANFAGTLSML